MAALFSRHASHDVGGRPALRSLLDGADIEDAVVQVVDDGPVGFLHEKHLVHVDGVSGEEGGAGFRGETADVGEKAGGGLLGGSVGGEDGRGEAGGGVGGAAPLGHAVEAGGGDVDGGGVAGRVEGFEGRRGDLAVDLEDLVGGGVEAGHLVGRGGRGSPVSRREEGPAGVGGVWCGERGDRG